MAPSPFGARPAPNGRHASLVKAWARKALGLADDVTVLVSELHCSEPGCPPTETVIAVLKTSCTSQKYKILKPLSEIAESDVLSACTAQSTAVREH